MTVKELGLVVKGLESRIEELEKIVKLQQSIINDFVGTANANAVRTQTVDSKESKEVVVGNLIFSGKYVKTGTGFMSSKTRYAISQSITNDFGGTKLAKGNPVYDKCHKADKYVQVYEFKTVADCKKFMAEQQKRVAK